MKTVLWLCLAAGFAAQMSAADVQGVIADWNCVQPMVQQGREKTLKSKHSCSLMKSYNRSAYGLITDDKKYYRLDDAGNAKIRQMLKDSPDKDNLHVIVTGEINGDSLKVGNISLL